MVAVGFLDVLPKQTCAISSCIHIGGMNVTLKDFPDDLHSTLKAVAEQSGRSLCRQVIYTSEGAVRPRPTNEENLLQRIKARRQQSDLHITQQFLEKAISEGGS